MQRNCGFTRSFFAVCVVCVALLAVMMAGTWAHAAEKQKQFVVEDGEWIRRKGSEKLETPVPNGAQETEIGWIYWLFVNPDVDESLKGETRGVHFYSDSTKKFSFLPLEKGREINGIHFSPDGKRLIIESPGEDITLTLYTFADLELHFEAKKVEMVPMWVDPARFIYSRYEPGTSRGVPDDYADEWISLVIYDVLSEKEAVLKAATKTSNFSLLYLNEKGDIVADESWVKSAEDWADPENKVKSREIVVPIPAAN